MSWIKIDGVIFNCREIQSQLSIGSHATVYLDFNLVENPSYENPLLNMYEMNLRNLTIESKTFIARGCKMKTLNINANKSISIAMSSDYMELISMEDRRDQNLEDILNIKN
jgi:hypothetical protein